jgi:hypothetical protein
LHQKVNKRLMKLILRLTNWEKFAHKLMDICYCKRHCGSQSNEKMTKSTLENLDKIESH